MKNINFFKQMMSILLLLAIFTGCSSKSHDDVGLKVNAGNDQNVIVGTSFTLTAKATGNKGDVTYAWKDGETEAGNSATLTKKFDTNGEHTYTVTVTDTDGKSVTDTVSVKVGKYVIKRKFIDKDGDGQIDDVVVYAYDDNGRLVSEDLYEGVQGEKHPDDKAGMSPSKHTEYAYDDNGNLISVNGVEVEKPMVSVDSNGVKTTTNPDGTKTIDEYDDNGINTKHSVVNSYGNLIYSIEAIVDDEGVVTERREDENGDGTVDKITTYVYNALPDGGHEAVATEKDVDGNTIKTVKSTYDKDGHLATVETTDADGKVTKNTYDKDDHLIKVEVDGVKTEERTYDEHGNLLTVTNYDAGGNVTSQSKTSYEYLFIYKY